METSRHKWVLVRNESPRSPSFHGAPQPKHRPGEADRNALILMAYFRSFTLQDADLDGVSRVSEWFTGEQTLAQAARE
eukprot:8585885-Pyramimonas_sp.AAC.1